MNPRIVVGIVTLDNKILLVKRKPTESSLIWQFPGGTVENDETLEQAIVRELREEAGITVKVLENIGERIHPYTQKLMTYIACEYVEGDLCVSDDDLECAEWISISEVRKHFTTPLYEKIATYLNI